MLYDWMKSVILYLLLAGLALHMAPSSQYRKYIRYFIGLVVLVLLASPISYLFHFGSGDLQELLAQMESGWTELSGDERVGGDLYDYYDISLRESMKQELISYGVTDVSLTTGEDGSILQCTVWVSGDGTDSVLAADSEQKIKNYISDVYNVEHARIYVVRR